MKNNYIPDIFKEKIYLSMRYIYSLFFFILFVLSALALLTFDINDNSFLTSTSNTSNNLLGDVGSYFASFVFYTFGIMGYLTILFFLIFSILILISKSPKYIFIRLLLFFISLILIPQTFLFYELQFTFIESIQVWGVFALQLFTIHELEYVSYLFSLLGIVKKEPIINSISETIKSGDEIENENYNKSQNLEVNYQSPSLEILDTEETVDRNKQGKDRIKFNSDLLEKVFEDFNIEIEVVNVKLGPVVTLFEILPAAGIKINTIINLADDISRSMGVGAVRIAQIFGTQYLGVEVPNDQRETVTIRELLSDENFKKTSSKIPICICLLYTSPSPRDSLFVSEKISQGT